MKVNLERRERLEPVKKKTTPVIKLVLIFHAGSITWKCC